MRSKLSVAPTFRPDRGCIDTTDLDEVCAAASAAQHPIRADLTGPRLPFRFRLERRARGALSLARVQFDYAGRYVVDAPPIESHYHLQIPLSGRARVRHGNREVITTANGCGLILSPEEATQWCGSGPFEELTLNLARDCVDRHWTELTGAPPSRGLRFTPGLPLDGEAADVIRTLAAWCWNEADGPSIEGSDVQDALLGWLLLRVPHDHPCPLPPSAVLDDECRVQDAEAWFLRCATHRASVQEAAAAQGITSRTLQRAFVRRRTYTPRAFARRVRFECARDRLRQAGAQARVTDVAVGLGFGQLGRFSVDYRRRFGESPSATLRRSRARP